MTRFMLASSFALSLSMIPTARAAPVVSSLAPLPTTELPAQCRALAAVPRSAQIVGPDFAAHLSVANCLAEDAIHTVVPLADRASMASLELAMQPSVAILDDIIAHGDAHWRFLAEAAKADLYSGMVVDLRASAGTPELRAALEPQLAPWIERTQQLTHDLTALATHARIGDDPVTRYELTRFGPSA